MRNNTALMYDSAANSPHDDPGDVASRTCPYCGKLLKNKISLPDHVRTHTGEKPYKCDLCDYTAGRRFSIKSHLKHKHKIV